MTFPELSTHFKLVHTMWFWSFFTFLWFIFSCMLQRRGSSKASLVIDFPTFPTVRPVKPNKVLV